MIAIAATLFGALSLSSMALAVHTGKTSEQTEGIWWCIAIGFLLLAVALACAGIANGDIP